MLPYRLIAEVISYLGLVILALIWRVQRDEARANFTAQVVVTQDLAKMVSAQTEQLLTEDKLHAAEVKNQDLQLAAALSDGIRSSFAAGRIDAANHARSMCASVSGKSDLGAKNLSGVPGSSEGAFDPGYQTRLDDDQACSDNTVKAEKWLEWWEGARKNHD